MPNASPAFHQLHLFLVGFHDAAIRIRIGPIANDKAIGERSNLEMIANSCHWPSLWHNVFKSFDQVHALKSGMIDIQLYTPFPYMKSLLPVAEAKALAADRPWSFLHISRPEIDLDDTVDPYDAAVYAKGRENLDRMIAAGVK